MKRLVVSEEYPFSVAFRGAKFWLSVHKTRWEAEKAADAAEDKYPKKTFIVFKYWPRIQTAYPVRTY